MTPELIASLALVALATLWLVLTFGHVERQSKRDAEARRALHEERMAALERGLDPPPAAGSSSSGRGRFDWTSLLQGLGFFLFFAGLGAVAGLRMVPQTPQMVGMQELSSLGLIPAMAGVGLLLHGWLLRRSGRQAGGSE